MTTTAPDAAAPAAGLTVTQACTPRPEAPVIIAVCGLKGGIAKSTTAVTAAALLSARYRTLLVDTDPLGSALQWARMAVMPFDVARGEGEDLARNIIATARSYEIVIIDTPPLNISGVVAESMLASSGVILPMQPTATDGARMAVTMDLVRECRERGADFWLRGLLVRTRAGTRSRETLRQALLSHGLMVCATEIPQRESIAQSLGLPVPPGGPYQDLIDELAPLLPLPATAQEDAP